MKINLLKGKMAEQGIDGIRMSQLIGRAPSYMYNHLKKPDSLLLSEIYIICEVLEIPFEDIPKYFPKEGERC